MAEQVKNNILIIEDDSYISDMYKMKLESEGFQVVVEPDGLKGIEQLKASRPDLVLLDVVMPKMDGFSVLEAIKGDAAVQDVPVIMLTNLGQKDSVEKGLKLGAADYIIKAHFTPMEVVEKVKEFLSK